ncbi:NAD(P)H-dependent flavin oxidoreductase [Nonomuraea endophytica]|uniref:Nitronate monooxygenase n=1 Tax=Nonomuraea endophytica TaxID=714136 RepID=A0A7W8ADE0_9ACTN|nr:nitronate monooxygenase [Nonomuraea endophytica]MBB5082698.1 nitronate monooxygenase [Nonomuraea endophytica]
MRTWVTERFGLEVPLVGAPMAGAGGGLLAAAVSGAGALGMFGVGPSDTPEWIAEQAALAGGLPFGIGLMAWTLPGNPAQVEAVIAARPSLVSVSFGDYTPYVEPLRSAGIAVVTQAGTTREAVAAERAVVARGGEGGGHGRDAVATLPLLQSVLDAVSVPVLAAGGIAGARGLAAVLAAGAEGAWVGTAFLACTEARGAAPAKRRILEAGEEDTAYGRVFDVAQRLAWPWEYGGRALRNHFFDTWHGRERELAEDDQAAAELSTARAAGDYDTAYIYAGQSAGMVREERPAAAVVAEFAGAEALLRRWS